MAGNRRNDNSKNPFYTDEDNFIDDDTFLRHSKSGSSGYMFGSNTNDLTREQQDLEERRMQLLERKRQIEERTIESSNRSVGLLRDSEQIGVATAEVGHWHSTVCICIQYTRIIQYALYHTVQLQYAHL